MTEWAELAVCIAIPTFRRPAELAECLPLVAEHVADSRPGLKSRMLLPSILVIDNDPMASARAVVIAAAVDSPVTLRYVVEPRPGIAAARNRALLEAENADVLVFLDDDERPTASWLVPLIDTWERSGAAAVMGRVISVFDTPLEPWIAAGEFFRRRSMPTGTEIEVGAAGNLLLDLMQVHQLGVQFDERIALGAGEDSLFTRQLVQRGGRLVWCEESVATDHVPPQRMTRRWVLDRARSHGNTEVVVELLVATTAPARRRVRALAAMRGGIRVAAGAARFSLGLVAGSLRHQARGLRTAYRGLGMASAALGVVVHEYARNHEHANI